VRENELSSASSSARFWALASLALASVSKKPALMRSRNSALVSGTNNATPATPAPAPAKMPMMNVMSFLMPTLPFR